jgi:hypothetical protein
MDNGHVNSARRTELFSALPLFKLDWRWRCRRDRDGEGDGDNEREGDGDGEGDGEGDDGRWRYLKEDGDIKINNVPCVIRTGPNLVRFNFQIMFRDFFLVRCTFTNG